MAAGWSPLMSEAYFKRGACQGGEISTREAGKIANDRWGKEQTSAKPAQIHHARILCPKNGGVLLRGLLHSMLQRHQRSNRQERLWGGHKTEDLWAAIFAEIVHVSSFARLRGLKRHAIQWLTIKRALFSWKNFCIRCKLRAAAATNFPTENHGVHKRRCHARGC